jgi:hypothetical protein
MLPADSSFGEFVHSVHGHPVVCFRIQLQTSKQVERLHLATWSQLLGVCFCHLARYATCKLIHVTRLNSSAATITVGPCYHLHLLRRDSVQEPNGSAVCFQNISQSPLALHTPCLRYDGLMFHASGADEDGIFTLQVRSCLYHSVGSTPINLRSQARLPNMTSSDGSSHSEENVAAPMSKVSAQRIPSRVYAVPLIRV